MRERLRERRARLTRVEEERREGWWVVGSEGLRASQSQRERERKEDGARASERPREREREIATGAIEIERSDNGRGTRGLSPTGGEDRDITIAGRSHGRRREGNPGKMERLEREGETQRTVAEDGDVVITREGERRRDKNRGQR